MPFSLLSPRETLVAATLSALGASSLLFSILAGFATLGSAPWPEGDAMLARAMARCNELPHSTQRHTCARDALREAGTTRLAQLH